VTVRPFVHCGSSRILLLSSLVALALLGRTSTGQEPPASGTASAPPAPPGTSEAAAQQPTFRLEANFVRVDVFPTKHGASVRDLTAADFEVLEDGVPQKIETVEHVEVRGRVPADQRREPSSVAEGRAMAEDPRSRVFVVFLDTYHTSISGSHRIRRVLVDLLDRVIGPDDLFAVMTPYMSARDITLARRTQTTEAMLSKYWYWGERDRLIALDPAEKQYELCYPDEKGAPVGVAQCPVPTDPTGQRTLTQGSDTYKGIAREMKARRREKRALDALRDLSVYLRGIREERKAVIAITDGWALYRPNPRLARIGACDTPPMPGVVGVGPDGRLTADVHKAQGYYSRVDCEADRQMLAHLDNWQDFRDLLDVANRSNVSFYPIDSRGLPATDAEIYEDVPPAADQRMLRQRVEALRTLADSTDGLAVVESNDLERGVRRIVDDLTSDYLLGYYSTNASLDGKFRSIKVRVTRPGVEVRARRGYRAASKEEIEAGKQMTQAAAAAAPPTAVQAALGALAGMRREVTLRTGVSWVAAPLDDRIPGAKSYVWVVGDVAPGVARGPEWIKGGRAEVVLTAEDGVTIAERSEQVDSSPRTIAVELPDVALGPGEYMLRLRVRPEGDGLPLQDTIRFTVPDQGAAVGEPRVLRAGASAASPFAPTADLQFRRSERIRVEVPVLGPVEGMSAELLDRNGKPLSIPVQHATRAGEGAVTWCQAEAVLAPLAPADYVLKVTLAGSPPQEVVTAFRLVP
jgi:VWFA-related protein